MVHTKYRSYRNHSRSGSDAEEDLVLVHVAGALGVRVALARQILALHETLALGPPAAELYPEVL